MFEAQADVERRRGIRGPFTRYFAKLANVADADVARRDVSVALLGITALFVLTGFRLGGYGWFAAFTGLPALVLLAVPSRIAAAAVIAFGGFFTILAIVARALSPGANIVPGLFGAAILILPSTVSISACALESSARFIRHMTVGSL